MVDKKIVNINGVDYIYRYSTENRYLIRDGNKYSEAIDPIGSDREYTEGDIMPEDIIPEMEGGFDENEFETETI